MSGTGRAGRTRGWVVGQVAGAPVVISPGWAVAAVVLVAVFGPTVQSLAPATGTGAYLVAGAFVVMLLASVFLHELAHALVARRRGLEVRELAITLLGGHTQFGTAAASPATSALVAVVGPGANLALGGLAWLVALALPDGGLAALVVTAAAVANGFVGVFNLVPGLPLDGGRVLEAVVWRITGNRWAGTVAAGWVGRGVAVGVLAWVLVVPLVAGRTPSLTAVIWGALIGAFLWSGADQAVRAGRAERAVESVTVAQMMRPASGVPVTGTLADLDQRTEAVLLGADGEVVGYVDGTALATVPAAYRAGTPLDAVAVPLAADAVLDATLRGRAAVSAVAQVATTSPVMAAVDPSGRVVGIVRALDVVELLRRARGLRT